MGVCLSGDPPLVIALLDLQKAFHSVIGHWSLPCFMREQQELSDPETERNRVYLSKLGIGMERQAVCLQEIRVMMS